MKTKKTPTAPVDAVVPTLAEHLAHELLVLGGTKEEPAVRIAFKVERDGLELETCGLCEESLASFIQSRLPS